MIVHTNTKAPAVKAPAFDSFAKPIMRGLESFDKAASKFSTVLQTSMQAYIDTCATNDVPRDEKGCKALGKAIRECETFKHAVDNLQIEKKTITEYAQSAMRAYFHAVPWAASLKNDTELTLPWGKSTGGKGATSGKVESTSRAELDKTLSKALKQARLLGLTEFAANVLDLCIESLDDFSETAE